MEKKTSVFENLVNLIRSLVWPALILVFFLSYRLEFNQIVEYVPEMVKRSSKVTVGGITLEVQNIADSIGYPELGELIPSMTNQEIKTLLKIGEGRHMVLSNQGDSTFHLTFDVHEYNLLDSKGLIDASYSYSGPAVPIIKFLDFYGALPLTELGYEFQNTPIVGFDERLFTKCVRRSDITEEDWLALRNYGVELTDEGYRAYEIIIEAVSNSFKE